MTGRCIVVLTAVLCSAPHIAAGGDAAWQWSPYRVAFEWDIADRPQLEPPFRDELRSAVADLLRERFGPGWVAADAGVDKRFAIRVDYDGEYVCEVREWDALLGDFGPIAARRTPQRAAAADVVTALVIAAFRPVLTIDAATTSTARVRQRAAGLFSAATLERLTRRGAAYVPIIRRFDRDGAVIDSQPIPWTLLEIDEPRGGEAVCVVHSGLNNPLSIRRRGRVEKLAVAVAPAHDATTVRVTTRDGRPLAGCRVLVQDGDAPATPLAPTDDRGEVVVPATDGRIRTLVVTSRFRPLARLPLLPGAVDAIEAPTIGEPELLAAEDRLVAWQAAFHDAYVQRRVLAALAAGYVDADDRAEAFRALTQLDAVRKPSDLSAELESLRRRYAAAPQPSGAMIEKLIDDAVATVRAVDDAAEVADLRKRIAAK